MRCRLFLCLVLLAAPIAQAQQWRFFNDGALFATYVTETGPATPENRVFSTNWLELGATRDFSASSSIAFGARLSAEPVTIPREGYPQLLQYISPQSGGPLVDHMRAHDAVEELAMQLSVRALRLYLAPVGEPPLGPTPFAQRLSSIDFAEAPFAYDVAESFHVATRVVAAGVATKAVTIEGGIFHAAQSSGRHTSLDDGDIDSWSARGTLHVTPHFSLQGSHGKLGHASQNVTSASASYETSAVAFTAMWTKRDPLNAYGAEVTLRGGPSTFMARVENVDRPAGEIYTSTRSTTHFTIGYIFDILRGKRLRTGIGANVDYHTGTHSLRTVYGHKPQGLYAFVRVRTTPPASP